MIFVCLGTQIFQMNRLLQELDRLIKNGEISEPVFAQIGKSDYKPVHFEYKDFITPEEYQEKVNAADMIITHGGTGAIVKSLKAGKQTIAVPRLYKYGEHENDHQLQIIDFFFEGGFILKVTEMDELLPAYKQMKTHPIEKKFVGDGHVLDLVGDYIDKCELEKNK